MNKISKSVHLLKLCAAICSVFCFLVLAGCFGFGKKNETITLLVAKDSRPYCFKDIHDDVVVGFEIDLMNHVSKKLGRTLKIKEAELASIFADIEVKNADCAVGAISAIQDRKKIYDFSSVYTSTKLVLLSKKGSKISSPEDLFSKTLAVQSGSTCELVAKKLSTQIFGIIVKPLQNNDVLIEELLTDGSDAIIIDSLTAEYFCNDQEDLAIVCQISEDLYSPDFESIGIMLPKGSALTEKINAAIVEMQKDGSLGTLEQLWLKKPHKIENIPQEEDTLTK